MGETLVLLDLSGREVYRSKVTQETMSLDVSCAVNGIYLVRIQNGVLPLRIQR